MKTILICSLKVLQYTKEQFSKQNRERKITQLLKRHTRSISKHTLINVGNQDSRVYHFYIASILQKKTRKESLNYLTIPIELTVGVASL